jgi:hypothetical protein
MSDTQTKGMDLLLTGLRNQHAVENQAISLLSRQVELGRGGRKLAGHVRSGHRYRTK